MALSTVERVAHIANSNAFAIHSRGVDPADDGFIAGVCE